MQIRDWNPKDGPAAQGDVLIARLPEGCPDPAKKGEEIRADERGFLLLQEGEATGHFHAIWQTEPARFHDAALARELEAPADETVPGTARLYRSETATNWLVARGYDIEWLVIGYLVVKYGPVTVRHSRGDGAWAGEHDAIRVPPGRYYVGGQREMDAGEARRIAD